MQMAWFLYTGNLKTTQKMVRTDKVNRIIVYKINVQKIGDSILFLTSMQSIRFPNGVFKQNWVLVLHAPFSPHFSGPSCTIPLSVASFLLYVTCSCCLFPFLNTSSHRLLASFLVSWPSSTLTPTYRHA